MHLLVALALAGSPRALERCEGGRVDACGPAAERLAGEDLEAAFLLAEWACREGEAPACAVWAEMLPQQERHVAWREGCALGDAQACGIAVEAGPDGRMDLFAAVPGCALGEPRSCARLEEIGWRSDLVTAVRHVPYDGRRPRLAVVAGTPVWIAGHEERGDVAEAVDVVAGTTRMVASVVHGPSASGLLLARDGVRAFAILGDDGVVWPSDDGPPVRLAGAGEADVQAGVADGATGILAAVELTGSGAIRRWRLDTGERLADVPLPGAQTPIAGSDGWVAVATPEGIAWVELLTAAVERSAIRGYPVAAGPRRVLVTRPSRAADTPAWSVGA